MYLKQLVQSGKTVFSVNDLQKIWLIADKNYLKTVVNRLFKRGEVIRISRGLYVLKDSYDAYEFANKLKKPSYVSLETILQKEGVVFQDYDNTVFSISNNSITKKIGDMTFQYAKISDEILMDPLGIVRRGQANIATVERAICDRIYLSPNYYFDNLRDVNRDKLSALSRIYNARVQKEIAQLIADINYQ